MAVSSVEICNSALIKCGAQTITSLSDNTKSAKLCNLQYDRLRKELLSSHPWNFAMHRKEVALTGNTPAFKYSNEFLLPVDVLRVWSTNLENFVIPSASVKSSSFVSTSDEWKVELNSSNKKVIVTNATTMKILYVRDVTDTTLFPPYFDEALAFRIAYDISYSLQQSTTKTDQLIRHYELFLARARSFDAQEGSIEIYAGDPWLEVRY